MKQHYILAAAICMMSLTAQAQTGTMDINGKQCAIDTTSYYQAGPGIQHTAFTLTIGSTKHNCYMLEIDLNNRYNTVEEYQSQGRTGATEQLADAYKKLDAEGHRSVGGVNCNFWVVSSQITGQIQGLLGQPYAGTARNGVLIGEPSDWNAGHGDRGYVMIDRQKRVWIDNVDFAGTVKIGGTDYAIRDVNRTRVNPNTDEITLFNHYIGSTPTRSTDGIEVVFSTAGWNINGTMECTVKSINTTGGTVIKEGTGVLQGRGTGASALSQLKEGDTFTMNLGVVSTYDETLKPDIMQMVTGNALILKNGVQTNRNTNEAYNNKNYPRTVLATNASRDKMWMFVTEKPGMYTADMCAVLQKCGATEAAGMDGGGSAQMCLGGKVINYAADGTPRAVANSIWVFSTAPDDQEASTIIPSVKKIKLPKYGTLYPDFMGYNQYGVLLSKKLEGVRLSCDEATGYIDSEGRFVCLNSGEVTATYGNARTTIQVEMAESSDIQIRLDSVLISNNTNYTIEVYSTVNGKQLFLQPEALSWRTEDASVCSVTEKGVINGVNNGSCRVYGTLNGKTDSILVHVEIPEKTPLAWNTDFTADTWEVQGSNSAWNTRVMKTGDGISSVTINFTGGRGANLKLIPDLPLYSLPDYIEFRYDPRDFPIQRVTAIMYANNSKDIHSFVTNSVTTNQTNTIVINVDSVLGHPNDIAVYPIRLDYISFTLDVNADKREYTMTLDGIYLHYGKLSLGVQPTAETTWSIYPNPTEDALVIRGANAGEKAVLYDMLGRIVSQHTLEGEEDMIDIQAVHSGQYILKINNNTTKVIKR